jgi:hypothetical protein
VLRRSSAAGACLAEGQIDPVAMTGPDGKPLSKGEIKASKDFQMLDFNRTASSAARS